MECRAPFDFRSRYVPNLRHRAESMNIRPGGDAIRRQRSRKEVFQPHLPVRLPCYDFTPLTRRTLGTAPLSVRLATSGTSDSDGVTGGVYKARERIHRAMLMRDY